MEDGPPVRIVRALLVARLGLCIQIPLAMWLDYLFTQMVSGTEPFGRKWFELLVVAGLAYYFQKSWLLSHAHRRHWAGDYLWLLAFWIVALLELG